MALDNYSGLKEAIAAFLVRDELTSRIDDFISLAEERHRDEIRIRAMLRRSQATLDSRFLALPPGYLQMVTFRLLTEPTRILQEVNLDEMNRRRSSTPGVPGYYTIHEELEFDRATPDTVSVEMIYYTALDPITEQNPTNPLLTRKPGVYLYGSLVAAAPYLIEDERVPLWEGFYTKARDTLNDADRKSRKGGPLVSRVVGPTP